MTVMFQVNSVEKERHGLLFPNYGIHYPNTCGLSLIYLARLR